jgi:hypothetical protein
MSRIIYSISVSAVAAVDKVIFWHFGFSLGCRVAVMLEMRQDAGLTRAKTLVLAVDHVLAASVALVSLDRECNASSAPLRRARVCGARGGR